MYHYLCDFWVGLALHLPSSLFPHPTTTHQPKIYRKESVIYLLWHIISVHKIDPFYGFSGDRKSVV